MVYCSKCGTKNEDKSEVCIKCGSSLFITKREARRIARRREKECFGLPNGGAIAGLIFGIISIIWGLSLLAEIDIWSKIFYMLVIIFGTLVVTGSIYTMTRSSRSIT